MSNYIPLFTRGHFWPLGIVVACVCLSVGVCVYQSINCPPDNSRHVETRITKFGPKMQNTLVKDPIVLGGNRPWTLRSNSKVKIYPFWACPHNNSPPVQARTAKFRPEVQNALFKIPNVLKDNWPWPSRSNLTWKSNFLVSPALKTHNSHVTTREPWVPRLLHRPDCFMVSILGMYSYIWAVSWSWLFHSINTLHLYWSWQPRVFWCRTLLLLCECHYLSMP